jgi:uncharacterized protein (TIGR02265 family)
VVQTEQVVFENTVRALLDAVGGRLTPAAREELRVAGLDLSRPLLPAYPAAQWAKQLHIVARAVFPDASPSEGLRQLGWHVIGGWRRTLVGRAAESMAKLVGPRRTLQRLSHHLRSSDNFCETRFTARGERDVELWVSEVLGMPTYFQGIVEHVVEGSGGKAVLVELVREDGPACVFHVRWS